MKHAVSARDFGRALLDLGKAIDAVGEDERRLGLRKLQAIDASKVRAARGDVSGHRTAEGIESLGSFIVAGVGRGSRKTIEPVAQRVAHANSIIVADEPHLRDRARQLAGDSDAKSAKESLTV